MPDDATASRPLCVDKDAVDAGPQGLRPGHRFTYRSEYVVFDTGNYSLSEPKALGSKTQPRVDRDVIERALLSTSPRPWHMSQKFSNLNAPLLSQASMRMVDLIVLVATVQRGQSRSKDSNNIHSKADRISQNRQGAGEEFFRRQKYALSEIEINNNHILVLYHGDNYIQ